MPAPEKPKGPWFHRFLIGLFTVLLTLLSVWLIGFVLTDFGSMPGPDYNAIERNHLSPALLSEADRLTQELQQTERKYKEQQDRQTLLRDSTGRYEQTLKQLVELQRLNAQKGVATDDASQKALNESVAFFLSNQKADLALNEELAKLNDQRHAVEERKRGVDEKLEGERTEAQAELAELAGRHDHKVAACQLLFLLPLLAIMVLAFLKRRGSAYAPLIYAGGAAVLWQTILVIHQHFPTQYFKYIALIAALAVVVWILISLLRTLRAPKMSWLLKQYREGYERFVCPVCEYPIRRGPLKHLFWTRRTIKKLTALPPAGSPQKDEPYSCPACGSHLFEECPSCHGVRHSLLPYCDQCGEEKTLAR